MLTPEYYNYCTDEVIELYSKLDETITRDIARRIMKTGYVTEGAKWLVEVEREAGLLYDEIIEKVAEHAEASEEAVRAVFNEAGLTSKAFDDEIYESAGLTPVPLKSSPAMLQVLAAGIAKTNGLLNNLTKTTALTSQTRFIEACSLAEFEITSGAFDYNTAIRHAVEHAVEQGTMVEYASGARRSLESAVRTAVMTGVSQTTGEISIANAKELGTDLMEISAHGGARPSHAEWQGQIVSLSGDSKGYLTLSDIGYGTIEGFKGINCRHDWWPFIEGISTRAYTDEELKEYRDETVEYNGKEMSVYEATQRQRAMERQIRQERCQLAGLDESIKSTSDKELKESFQGEFDHLALKMKGHEAKYSDFSNQTGLPALKDRLQTKGFNRSVSQKAVQSVKHSIAIRTKNTQYKEYLSQVRRGEISLKDYQQKILDKLPSAGAFVRLKKKDVSLDDLAALSAREKCEFALFVRGKKAILLRGNYNSCDIGGTLAGEILDGKWIWVGHSHPTITRLSPSQADIAALKHFTWQNKSSIIDLKGNVIDFTSNEQDWFNSLLGVK